MSIITRLFLWLPLFTSLYGLENTTCKKCHPVIFQEYQNSMHAKASVFKDPVHKAVWDRHPAKAKENYKCARCHTPADHQLSQTKGMPKPNMVQMNEPVSCQSCHTIENIEKHATANRNIYNTQSKYFYSADTSRKGQKLIFTEKKRFFGLLTETTGSPYHDIDYSNENYYNGSMCLGCHDHKKNAKGFAVCDMQIKQGDSKETCISCHMTQVQGSLANQKQSLTHAFHGASIHTKPVDLSPYVKLSFEQTNEGFAVTIGNEATHTLFPQPLRLSQLRITIERNGQETALTPVSFQRIIGTEGKPSMPWTATEVIKDNTIKALEKRRITFKQKLQKGDVVTARFGYYIVNPKAAKKLDIDDAGVTQFITLTEARFSVK